jgi:hypothetical protein
LAGVARSQCWMWLDGLAHDGGAIRRCGGVDGKPRERLHFDRTFWRWVHRLRGAGDLSIFEHKTHISLDIIGDLAMVVSEAQGLV